MVEDNLPDFSSDDESPNNSSFERIDLESENESEGGDESTEVFIANAQENAEEAGEEVIGMENEGEGEDKLEGADVHEDEEQEEDHLKSASSVHFSTDGEERKIDHATVENEDRAEDTVDSEAVLVGENGEEEEDEMDVNDEWSTQESDSEEEEMEKTAIEVDDEKKKEKIDWKEEQDDEDLFEMISRMQLNRLDDQRCDPVVVGEEDDNLMNVEEECSTQESDSEDEEVEKTAIKVDNEKKKEKGAGKKILKALLFVALMLLLSCASYAITCNLLRPGPSRPSLPQQIEALRLALVQKTEDNSRLAKRYNSVQEENAQRKIAYDLLKNRYDELFEKYQASVKREQSTSESKDSEQLPWTIFQFSPFRTAISKQSLLYDFCSCFIISAIAITTVTNLLAHFGLLPGKEPQPGTIRQVELTRTEAGFGFGVKGHFIAKIIKGGAAARQGKLRKGDEIIRVNTVDVKGHSQYHIAALIRAFDEVDLTVRTNPNRDR